MWSKLLAATGLTLALALPAMAQPTNPQSFNNSTMKSEQQYHGNGQTNMTSGQNRMHVRQQVKQDLQQAGFTNVQVMPESFLVRATDKHGRPVMMVINPDSITAVTEMGNGGQSGSASSGSSNSSSTMNSANSTNK